MKLNGKIHGLYAIVDSSWAGGHDGMAVLAEKYVHGGADIIQLRVKPSGDSKAVLENARAQMFVTACRVVAMKREHEFTLIINDHADIASQVGADGVHVGANDMPIREIRRLYGHEMLVGFSSHSVEEARWAEDMGADYVAFGAIFPTKTKGPGHPVQGTERLRQVVAAAGVPVVAIGGISHENIGQVLKTGAHPVAMISALALAKDPVAETRAFARLIRESSEAG